MSNQGIHLDISCGSAGMRPFRIGRAVGILAMAGTVAALTVWAGQGEGVFASWPRLTVAGWAAVLFIGLRSGVGYVLWLWALGSLPATRASVFLSLSPVTALLLGAALLGEDVPSGAVAGLLCLAAGLWFAARPAPTGDGMRLTGPFQGEPT